MRIMTSAATALAALALAAATATAAEPVQRAKGTLAYGQAVETPLNLVRKNVDCKAQIECTQFEAACVGRGYELYQSNWLKITRDSVFVLKQDAKGPIVKRRKAHKLRIGQYVSVEIKAGDKGRADITVSSGGKSFNMRGVAWYAAGKAFVKSLSQAQMQAYVSVSFADASRPVWFYGDSYFNYTDPARWPYYLMKRGCKNWMGSNMSGGDSKLLLECLKNDTTLGRPQYLVWCLGMNDGADTNEPSARWKTCLDEVIKICNQRGTKLVLATIPSVPTRNNELKNQWVRSSGLQYIDFAAAVGATPKGEWTEGMLEVNPQERVHPTAKGARALAEQCLKDFPQVRQGK